MDWMPLLCLCCAQRRLPHILSEYAALILLSEACIPAALMCSCLPNADLSQYAKLCNNFIAWVQCRMTLIIQKLYYILLTSTCCSGIIVPAVVWCVCVQLLHNGT